MFKRYVLLAFRNSLALQIIEDLSNNDKHGYPPRNVGKSGKSPRIGKVTRVMQLSTKPEKGSFVAMTLGPGGIPKIAGSGEAKAVITADIFDEAGNIVGDFRKTALQATLVWERLLTEFGVTL